METINTLRLRFRHFNNDDVYNLSLLDSDKEVMRYLTDGITFPFYETKKRLEKLILDNDQSKPLGTWAVEHIEDNEFAGWFILKPFPGFDHPEVGYRLIKKYWGYGLATEGVLGILNYGFNSLRVEKIMAITHPENTASIRVLKKTGLKFIKTVPFFNPVPNREVEAELFEISNRRSYSIISKVCNKSKKLPPTKS